MNGKTIKFGDFEGTLKETYCPLCPSEIIPKLLFKGINEIGLYYCPHCHIVYASPRFTEESLLKIYESEAFADLSFYERWSYEKWKESKDRSYIVSHRKVMLVKEFLPEGSRILDVGCSTGLFVLEASRQGFLCEGIDPSFRLTEIGRKTFKISLHSGNIDEFEPRYRFRGIMLWDVLEHVPNPIHIVKKCYNLLEPEGFLFLQVPNYKGISDSCKMYMCRLGLRRSFNFGFPWHIYAFDKRSLSYLMKVSKFSPVRFESWSHFLKDNNEGVLFYIATLFKRFCLSDYIICIARKMS
jgi:2-polyprenyl-3-methyl-5-hydroxy-6-metoxy-1,4-benzoquinol methylase